jgi:hypothetical protein
MTRDEIIELARASGLLPGTEWPTVETRHTKRKEGELTAFARAIEAATLERAAQACLLEMVDAEATGEESDHAYNNACADCSVAIRAMKGKEE